MQEHTMATNKNLSKKRTEDFSFHIIAGELKGRVIHAPNLGVTRPPLSRMRRSIFDYLNPYIMDASYLDLFSGTGSYLFEAVSRGAKDATGVELELQLVESINRHAKQFEIADRMRCIREDVFTAIPSFAKKGKFFDIIMIAPPQYQGLIRRTLESLVSHPILTPDGQILCQHDTSETRKIDFSLFAVRQQRAYGNTTFTILTPHQ